MMLRSIFKFLFSKLLGRGVCMYRRVPNFLYSGLELREYLTEVLCMKPNRCRSVLIHNSSHTNSFPFPLVDPVDPYCVLVSLAVNFKNSLYLRRDRITKSIDISGTYEVSVRLLSDETLKRRCDSRKSQLRQYIFYNFQKVQDSIQVWCKYYSGENRSQ